MNEIGFLSMLKLINVSAAEEGRGDWYRVRGGGEESTHSPHPIRYDCFTNLVVQDATIELDPLSNAFAQTDDC
jgi:hypothetical protein